MDNRFDDNHIEFNRQILEIIAAYAEKNPTQRFGQILFNLNINQFKDQENPSNANYQIRNIHGDSSEYVLSRVKDRIEKMNS
jgi:hypothetical protein